MVVLRKQFLGVFQDHVSLHADSRDGKSLLNERAEEICHTLHFRGLVHGVVVVEELHIGVSLMCILESQGDVVGAQNLPEQTLAGGSVVLETFIADIPGIDATLEMTHNGIDMLTHAFLEFLTGDEFAVLVKMEPRSTLGMPDEAMALYFQASSLRLVYELVGKGKVINTLLRMNHFTLHAVLCHHPVEVLGDDIPMGFLIALHFPLVHAHACVPIVAIGLCKTLCMQWQGHRTQSANDYFLHSL